MFKHDTQQTRHKPSKDNCSSPVFGLTGGMGFSGAKGLTGMDLLCPLSNHRMVDAIFAPHVHDMWGFIRRVALPHNTQ